MKIVPERPHYDRAAPKNPEPPFTGAISLQALLADQPRVREVGTNLDEIRAGHRLVVLDDDPTGTQTIADIPVLTSWSVDDIRWALRQPTTAFFILTNTRSLSEADAAERNRQIVTLCRGGRLEGTCPTSSRAAAIRRCGVLSAGDRRPRRGAGSSGTTVDGVVICPAYIEPGRVTVDSVHWTRTNEG